METLNIRVWLRYVRLGYIMFSFRIQLFENFILFYSIFFFFFQTDLKFAQKLLILSF